MRLHAEEIFRAGLNAADPVHAVRRQVTLRGDKLIAGQHNYLLSSIENIYVVGAGKASATMAAGIERILGRRITSGLVSTKYDHKARLERIHLNECGHPVPDQNGLEGARRIASIAYAAGSNDLVICLISGGASALLPAPAPPITLTEKQRTTQLLLDCGATIHEFNAVRKHLSTLKGGRLAALAHPARVLSLLLSDVVGDNLDVIGSGPTAADPSTFADARGILEKYNLWTEVPSTIRGHILSGLEGQIPETPKREAPGLARTQNLIIGSNRLALEAAAKKAKALGYRTLILSSTIEGDTSEAAMFHTAIAREIAFYNRPLKPPACVISGGETTVTLKGKGKGGRNQEFTLAAAIHSEGLPGVTILSAGTDGTDGPTDAAGAVACSETAARAQAEGVNPVTYLENNDSYSFFEKTGGLIRTGPTGTNVMDIRVILVDRINAQTDGRPG